MKCQRKVFKIERDGQYRLIGENTVRKAYVGDIVSVSVPRNVSGEFPPLEGKEEICGGEIIFPKALVREGQYRPSNIDVARESYGVCSRCGKIQLPPGNGSLDIWGVWVG